jgi:hypothetical protein
LRGFILGLATKDDQALGNFFRCHDRGLLWEKTAVRFGAAVM